MHCSPMLQELARNSSSLKMSVEAFRSITEILCPAVITSTTTTSTTINTTIADL